MWLGQGKRRSHASWECIARKMDAAVQDRMSANSGSSVTACFSCQQATRQTLRQQLGARLVKHHENVTIASYASLTVVFDWWPCGFRHVSCPSWLSDMLTLHFDSQQRTRRTQVRLALCRNQSANHDQLDKPGCFYIDSASNISCSVSDLTCISGKISQYLMSQQLNTAFDYCTKVPKSAGTAVVCTDVVTAESCCDSLGS